MEQESGSAKQQSLEEQSRIFTLRTTALEQQQAELSQSLEERGVHMESLISTNNQIRVENEQLREAKDRIQRDLLLTEERLRSATRQLESTVVRQVGVVFCSWWVHGCLNLRSSLGLSHGRSRARNGSSNPPSRIEWPRRHPALTTTAPTQAFSGSSNSGKKNWRTCLLAWSSSRSVLTKYGDDCCSSSPSLGATRTPRSAPKKCAANCINCLMPTPGLRCR